MAVNKDASISRSSLSKPMSFRHSRERREMLEAFARADGNELTEVLKEAVDFYSAERIRRGREAVRMAAIENPAGC